ncbi:MAG: AMP-binding protein [Phycisphaerales bacterium]|nr:AMP-binding protein [Phycisphaerales bacterium]
MALRTRGLWGSTFSFAYNADLPHLVKCLLRGFGVLLANLLVFTPRRQVQVTAELFTVKDLPGVQREQVNAFFDRWYNAPGPEKPVFVPYHFVLGPRKRDFPPLPQAGSVNLKQVKPETRVAVNQMLTEQLRRELSEDEQKAEITLDQLGLDSLDRMELSLAIEQRFGFHSDTVPTVLGDLWALAAGLVDNKPPKPPDAAWFAQPPQASLDILGESIPQAVVRRALGNRQQVIVADDLSGVLTYERLLTGALLLSKRIKEQVSDNANIGLMLPASVGSDVALLAIYLAGKLPIVLNWTTGPGNLAHAAKVTKLTHVITSQKFIDRTGLSVEGTQFLFMEELRQSIGKFEALLMLLKLRYLPGVILHQTPRPDPQSPAVVLFTSGSEKAPKAVPLSHHNLLSNIQSALEAFSLNRDAVMLGFLPVFHSFGLSVTTLLPLLAGLRCVHHPDPTDAGGLVRKIALYKPTLLCGTPTFVTYILDRGTPEQLASLRLIVVGAEKCPKALFDRVAAQLPKARVHEGYGITECSPLVSVNTPDRYKLGTIGVPLPGILLTVVEADSMQPLPTGERGMLLVSGPNVFAGYWGVEGPGPVSMKWRESDGTSPATLRGWMRKDF